MMRDICDRKYVGGEQSDRCEGRWREAGRMRPEVENT